MQAISSVRIIEKQVSIKAIYILLKKAYYDCCTHLAPPSENMVQIVDKLGHELE